MLSLDEGRDVVSTVQMDEWNLEIVDLDREETEPRREISVEASQLSQEGGDLTCKNLRITSMDAWMSSGATLV